MADVLPFVDSGERAQALDITRSFIVEAPAGSGKTGLLIQRMLKLLASESVTDPSQVLAITFTRKATHEMRDRVMQQLALAHRDETPRDDFDVETRPFAHAALMRDRQLGWELLDHPGRLNISTIDAFCAQIARSLPVLSGSGGQEPVEDASGLHAEAAMRTLNLLGSTDKELSSALELLLMHRDASLTDCAGLIAGMLGWRDQWGGLMPRSGEQLTETYLETEVLPKLNKALDQAICRALTKLTAITPPLLLERLCQLASEMAKAEGYNGARSPISICKDRSRPAGARADDIEHWAALAHLLITRSSPRAWRKSLARNHLHFEINNQHKAELKSLIDELSDHQDVFDALCAIATLPPAIYPAEQWEVAKALFRVLSRALLELQLVFGERGECDFTEFSLIASTSLRQATILEDLATSAGINLQHLLVDEMQDTSSAQYELIRLLTEHWDGASQTIFLVGDPKQSIYLFRQARVVRFLETLSRQRLGSVPLKALFLTTNFRSQANLVRGFNETFSLLFPATLDAADPEAVPYKAASAQRRGSPGRDIVWHRDLLPYVSDPKLRSLERDRARHRNGGAIRSLILAWRARPLPPERTGKPWKMAVLVRARTHLLAVVKALKQDPPVAFRAVNTEPLGERQEILDLLALTRALLHPADKTAWFALLRSPWCGLSLLDLHRLAGADIKDSEQKTVRELMEERGDELSPDGVARLRPFWTVLSAALRERGRLPLSQWIDRTRRAFAAELYETREQTANVERFFAVLDELESRPGPLDLGTLKSTIAGLYAAESTAADAVDLMTIHKAKGLEWDFVIVPALEASGGTNKARLLTWLELDAANDADEDAAHGIPAPVQPKGLQATALNGWMRSLEAAREAAERKRLLYVVCTRAREELHLFANPQQSKDLTPGIKKDSLLWAAWPAAQAMPWVTREEPAILEEIAAAGIALVPAPVPRVIERIPLSAFPAASREPLPLLVDTAPAPRVFDRPQGSFEARAFGNTMHSFLELLSALMRAGEDSKVLRAHIPTWTPRIYSVLRANGVAPGELARNAAAIERGLSHALDDADGLWVLAPHAQAVSESALASAAGTMRLDRSFSAGAEPGSSGESHRWIIDYKTGTHAGAGLDEYLANERAKYASQLEAYGRLVLPQGLPVRLGLYYPMLPRLLWWPFTG